MQITQKASEAIMGSNKVIAALAYEFNKTTKTIENWVEAKSPMLTTPMALRIISKECGISESEILEETSTAA